MRIVTSVVVALAIACVLAISGRGAAHQGALPADSGFVMGCAFEAGAPGTVHAATLEGDVLEDHERGRPMAVLRRRAWAGRG